MKTTGASLAVEDSDWRASERASSLLRNVESGLLIIRLKLAIHIIYTPDYAVFSRPSPRT